MALVALGLAASACASVPPPPPGELVAFPGAEGAGRLSLGGRGGTVIKVTNLEDSGAGSLRAAVEAKGPRTVVFETGGTIRLKTPLRIREGRITIAGQTAPGGGITLRDQPLVVAADDVVIRYIRSRLGDETGVQADAIDIVRGRRIILDHVSASWSVDETLSAGSRYDPPEAGVYDVTVQWSIIAESLNKSAHAKGEHGYGSLIRGGHGARMSFHHNLWANHNARMPRPGNYNGPDKDPIGPLLEFRSNVFYNWGRERAGYNADTAAKATYSFVDNAYVRGPDSKGAYAFEEKNSLARAWFAGNSMDGKVPADPWSLVIGTPPPEYRLTAAPDVAPVRAHGAAAAYEAVLARAGATKPRDAVDTRVVDGVRRRTGRIIDTEASVGGWPTLASGAPRPDRDGDGMPDAWERARGLDPARPDDAADGDRDGWTNLEEWLAELAA
ncbi:pectate lyase [Phenylobacterium sp.]|jgi:hypothetical protein|uniref:pectate lyase family protein n=1 Tax=Phenylobacterium sp. TaxID=1871053 RepID=UPI002F91E1F6